MLPVKITRPQAKNLIIMTGAEKHSSQFLLEMMMMKKQTAKSVPRVEATVIRFIKS